MSPVLDVSPRTPSPDIFLMHMLVCFYYYQIKSYLLCTQLHMKIYKTYSLLTLLFLRIFSSLTVSIEYNFAIQDDENPQNVLNSCCQASSPPLEMISQRVFLWRNYCFLDYPSTQTLSMTHQWLLFNRCLKCVLSFFFNLFDSFLI